MNSRMSRRTVWYKSTGVSEKPAGLHFTKHEINIKPAERSVSFRMLRRVGWLLATDVSGQAIGSIFKDQACQAIQAAVSSKVAVPVQRCQMPRATHLKCTTFLSIGSNRTETLDVPCR